MPQQLFVTPIAALSSLALELVQSIDSVFAGANTVTGSDADVMLRRFIVSVSLFISGDAAVSLVVSAGALLGATVTGMPVFGALLSLVSVLLFDGIV